MGAILSSQQEQSDLEALINLRDVNRQIEITKEETTIYEKKAKTAVLWFGGSIAVLVVLIAVLCLVNLPLENKIVAAGLSLLFVIICGLVWFGFRKKVSSLKKQLHSLEMSKMEIARELGV